MHVWISRDPTARSHPGVPPVLQPADRIFRLQPLAFRARERSDRSADDRGCTGRVIPAMRAGIQSLGADLKHLLLFAALYRPASVKSALGTLLA